MFLILKRTRVFLAFLAILFIVIFLATYLPIRAGSSPKPTHTIVIDAGHGGIDGGAVGKVTGVDESQLNLEYALTLQKLCEDFGIGVVLTRKDMNGLYSATAPNKKRSEMERRQQIISQSDADLVISLHMNSFPLTEARGHKSIMLRPLSRGRR